MIKTYKEYTEGVKIPSVILKQKEKEIVKSQEIKQYIFRWLEITADGWHPDSYKVEIDNKIIEIEIINGIMKTTDKRIKDYLLKREFELLDERILEDE